MLWRGILADVLVVAHAAYAVFIVLGLVAILAGVGFAGDGCATRGSAISISP